MSRTSEQEYIKIELVREQTKRSLATNLGLLESFDVARSLLATNAYLANSIAYKHPGIDATSLETDLNRGVVAALNMVGELSKIGVYLGGKEQDLNRGSICTFDPERHRYNADLQVIQHGDVVTILFSGSEYVDTEDKVHIGQKATVIPGNQLVHDDYYSVINLIPEGYYKLKKEDA